MNKKYIIGIIVLAVALGAVISLVNDSRMYADFETAMENPEVNYEIVGTLDTTEQVIYDAMENPDQFTFYMIDEKGKKMKVVGLQSKPQDFEKSVQVVASGNVKDDAFHASKILMKCPSKYEDSAGPPDFVKQAN
jgi:cytochrome c-type biogenesis protein CcmE